MSSIFYAKPGSGIRECYHNRAMERRSEASAGVTLYSFSEIPTGLDRPLLYDEASPPILAYSRRPLIGLRDFPRREGLKPLTDRQVEAMDLLEELAAKAALAFHFKTGDIQYVNNLAVLHAREEFGQDRSPGCRRHLLRMFIKDERSAHPVPKRLADLLDPMYDHDLADEAFPWSLGPIPYILSP